MEQGRLSLGLQQVADIAQARQVPMDDGVPPADGRDQQIADRFLFAGGQALGGRPEIRQLAGRHLVQDRRLDQHPSLRVGRQQRRDVGRVEVVGVLVGDQHRVEVGQRVPGVGEIPRVQQDPCVVGFDQHGGMA